MYSQGPRDWAWRRRVRAHPTSRRLYRLFVGTLGGLVVIVGLVLVPMPGPGWLVVFLGVGVLASEFAWAGRLHAWGWRHLQAWEAWVRARSRRLRAALGTLTAVAVVALIWGVLKWTGVPGWAPPAVAVPVRHYLGL